MSTLILGKLAYPSVKKPNKTTKDKQINIKASIDTSSFTTEKEGKKLIKENELVYLLLTKKPKSPGSTQS